ncbi:hypothetical protein ACFL1Z_03035 [Thermodesulfobacteriota bacterium]
MSQNQYLKVVNDHDEFDKIRGSIVFPKEDLSGFLLIGVQTEGKVKILEECEFRSLPEAKKRVVAYKEKYRFLRCVYIRDIPENEGFGKYLEDIHCSEDYLFFLPAPFSENEDFGIQLIGSYLADNKLLVPENGVLAKQLQAGWDSVQSAKVLHGILALGHLLSGMDYDNHPLHDMDLS